MYEIHKREQYFFDHSTLEHLSEFVRRFSKPCCLCAPLLGKHLEDKGVSVAVLDVDERFATLRGFRRYDIYRPKWLGLEFDIIVCDPPFFSISLSQLFTAIRMLSRFDCKQSLLLSYLRRRSHAVIGTFAPYGLQPTGYLPAYQTVQECEKNEIEFFSNLPETIVSQLRSA